MKKLLLTAVALLSLCAFTVPRASAQSASFIYSGIPASPVTPGSSFTIGISVMFMGGGTVANLNGLSYWFAQTSPSSSFPFSITSRDVTGSMFNQLQSPGLTYPQVFSSGDIVSHNSDGSTGGTDLGALSQNPMNNGTFFVANITFMAAPGAAPGSYTFANTTTATSGVGGRFSVVNDSAGHTAGITASPFTVTVVPEPSTYALMGFAGLGLLAVAYRRRRAA